jgi:CheY-like chemotaxis protein
MDEETLRRATVPFFTTKEPGKGTGLGLSMIHGIAEQSGGKFILHSTKDKGTTAELWLPIAKPGARVSEGIPPDPEISQDRALAILAVDDDSLVLTNTVAMLEDMGHRVVAAASAREALAIFGEEHGAFDLLITDHVMPHMSGVRLAAEIRREVPDIPIILATGYAELEPGVAADIPRLSKPFSQTELAAIVNKVSANRALTGRVIPFRPGNGH